MDRTEQGVCGKIRIFRFCFFIIKIYENCFTPTTFSSLYILPSITDHIAFFQINIPFLASLSQLEYLNLYGTRITDKSLKSLSALKNLRQLFVWQTGVTTKGVEELRKSLPKLKVSMGVDLLTIVDEKKRDKPEAPTVLKWLPEGGDKKPPKRSVFGTFIMVYFENRRNHPVKLYWIDYSGSRKLYGEIAKGGERQQNTYSDAVWLVTDEKDKPIGYFVAGTKMALAIIPK